MTEWACRRVCGPWLIAVPFVAMLAYVIYYNWGGARQHEGMVMMHVFLGLGFVLMLSYLYAFCLPAK